VTTGTERLRFQGCRRDETVDGAFQKHARILVDEIGAMAVAGDKVEIALLQEVIFDAAHDGSGIAVADLGTMTPMVKLRWVRSERQAIGRY